MSTALETALILIVDDDEVLGQVLGRVLTRNGRTAVRASNVAQALEKAAQQQPQLALIDLCLPDGDGLDLARQLREKHPNLPLILMTAYPVRLREQPELAEQFTRVLIKPLNLQELRQAVDAALGESSAPAPPRERPAPVAAAVAPAPAIGHVTVVREEPPRASSRSSLRKWAVYGGAAAALVLVLLFVPPFFGVPGLQALWTAPPERTVVEKKAELPVELVKGSLHTLAVPEDVLKSLGIRNGKVERIAPA